MRAANRGTLSQLPGRFAVSHSESDSPPVSRPTRYHREKASSIIMTNRSPDLPFEQSINPYRGCEHGCIYCYARPNHAYVDLSPGQDFESEIFCKDNAAEVLRDSLRKPSYRCRPIVLGTVTDPYQPIERERRITRELLQVLVAPVIPFINDHELEDIVHQVAMAGAQQAGYVVLRLPHEVGPLWQEWLADHYPDRAEKVMSVMRDLHGGAIYDSRWHGVPTPLSGGYPAW